MFTSAADDYCVPTFLSLLFGKANYEAQQTQLNVSCLPMLIQTFFVFTLACAKLEYANGLFYIKWRKMTSAGKNT